MSVCCEMCLVRTDRARGMCGVCLEGAAVFAGAADAHTPPPKEQGWCLLETVRDVPRDAGGKRDNAQVRCGAPRERCL